MRVGKLKELIKDLPDGILVVMESGDHSFREIQADVSEIVASRPWTARDGTFRCDVLSEHDPNSELGFDEALIKAVIIS